MHSIYKYVEGIAVFLARLCIAAQLGFFAEKLILFFLSKVVQSSQTMTHGGQSVKARSSAELVEDATLVDRHEKQITQPFR